jgi:hypothetical protein
LTQELAPETRNVNLTVESITGPQKSSGDWPIRAIVDGLGKYAMPLFVSSVQSPAPGATYDATLAQGKQKQNTDGSAPWHYFYDVVSFGTHAAPDSPVPAPQQAAQPQQQTQGTPVPTAPLGGWDGGNDIDRRESLKEISFHKQKSLDVAQRALGSTTESALMIEDYVEQLTVLYRAALALLREPMPDADPAAEEEVAKDEEVI